jgi:hypothetical protein
MMMLFGQMAWPFDQGHFVEPAKGLVRPFGILGSDHHRQLPSVLA